MSIEEFTQRGLVPRLWLGSLELTTGDYGLEFGADFGSPEAQRTILESRLYDGEVVSSQRAGNRTIEIPVAVTGANLGALGEAEERLAYECDREFSTLTYDPGDGFAKPSVYLIFKVDMKETYSDEGEIASIRRYTLSIPALPFARSATQSSATVTSLPRTGSTLADMETTAGWATTGGAIASSSTWRTQGSYSVQVESEAVGLDTSAARPVRVFENEDTLTLSSPYSVPAGGGSFSIAVRHSSLSTLGYAAKPVGLVRMDMIGTTGKTLASVVPSAVEYLGTAGGAAAGFVRYAVLPMLPAGMVVSAIRFAHRQVQRSGAAGVPSVWYDNLSFADTSVTSRHSLATVAITGAVRAPGSIAVKAPSTAALGNVLVLTTGARDQPATFMPACRVAGYQSAGSSDPATGLVALNATTSALGTTYTGLAVDVPLSSITSGAFELWLHATNSGSVTFAAQAQLVIGGVAVGPVVTTEGDTKASSSALRWVSAGRIELPSLPNPDSSAVVRIQFKVTAGSGAVDEVVLAPTTAAVTIAAVGNGTGSASGDSTRVWVDAPSTERIGGAWLRGVDDARTNARAVVLPDLVVPGRHVFAPRLMRIYVATPNVSGASSEISYYAQYHTRAAS